MSRWSSSATPRLLEEDGSSALLRVMRGGASYPNRVAEITDGRSHVISVADRGQVNTVRW